MSAVVTNVLNINNLWVYFLPYGAYIVCATWKFIVRSLPESAALLMPPRLSFTLAGTLAGSPLLGNRVLWLCGAIVAAFVIGLLAFLVAVREDAGKAAEQQARATGEDIANRLRVADQTLRSMANDLQEQRDEPVVVGATVQRYFENITAVDPEGIITPIHGTTAAAASLSERTRQRLANGDTLVYTLMREHRRTQIVMARKTGLPHAQTAWLVAVMSPHYLWSGEHAGNEQSEWCVSEGNSVRLFCSSSRIDGALSRLMNTRDHETSGQTASRANDGQWPAGYARLALPVQTLNGDWTVVVTATPAYGAAYPYLIALLFALFVTIVAWRAISVKNRNAAAVCEANSRGAPLAKPPEDGDARQRCVMAAMVEMDRAILSGANVDRLITLAARHLLACVGCDRVLLAIRDRETPYQATVAMAETEGYAPLNLCKTQLDPAIIGLLNTQPEGCWWEQPADFSFLQPLVERGCKQALLLPLYEDSNLSAVIALDWTDHQYASSDARACARALADSLGVALIAVTRAEALYLHTRRDVITALPNRRYLQEHLGPMLANTRREQQRLAVLFIDLDEFKQVNSAGGHGCGDLLLKAAGKRVRGCVREEDLVVHFGGDEFVVVLPRIRDALDARKVADKLLAVLGEPYSLEGGEFQLGASIGISIFPDDAQSTSELLRQAEFSMFRAKAAGRGQYAFFDEAMNRRAVERSRLELELKRATENQEFVVFYQPQINLQNGTIDGAEALIRWNHPQRGMVPPCDFIPVAEHSSVILQIGAYVLRTACEQFRNWESAGAAPRRVSVNVTAVELHQVDFADRVEAILEQTQLRPFCLELEITEGALIEDSPHVNSQLERLRARGVRIAIDDFGTGYSSLSYLKRLPIDVVKIDQSFVRDIGKDEDSTSIVRAMIDMAHSLGKRTVAEGVETVEHCALIQKLGCNVGQGYLWSRPLPAMEFEQLCRNWQPRELAELATKRFATQSSEHLPI